MRYRQYNSQANGIRDVEDLPAPCNAGKASAVPTPHQKIELSHGQQPCVGPAQDQTSISDSMWRYLRIRCSRHFQLKVSSWQPQLLQAEGLAPPRSQCLARRPCLCLRVPPLHLWVAPSYCCPAQTCVLVGFRMDCHEDQLELLTLIRPLESQPHRLLGQDTCMMLRLWLC